MSHRKNDAVCLEQLNGVHDIREFIPSINDIIVNAMPNLRQGVQGYVDVKGVAIVVNNAIFYSLYETPTPNRCYITVINSAGIVISELCWTGWVKIS
jgi:hypothetical protein